MKGDEMAIPFASYVAIALLAIVLILIILGRGQIALLGAAQKLEGLFEPDKFTACALVEGSCPESGKKVSDQNIAVDCVNLFAGEYIIKLEGVQFTYESLGDQRLGKSFNFVVLLDYGNRLVLGEKNDGTNTISCNILDESSGKYGCEKFSRNSPLRFHIYGVKDDRFLLHFTAWKSEPSILQAVQNPDISLYRLIDESYPYYIKSIDIPVKSVSLTNICTTGQAGGLTVQYSPAIPKTLGAVNPTITVTATGVGAYDKISVSIMSTPSGPIIKGNVCPGNPASCQVSADLGLGRYYYEAKLLGANNNVLQKSDIKHFDVVAGP